MTHGRKGQGDASATRRFYRIISQSEARYEDFLSDEEAGRPRPRNPDKVRFWRGRSCFATIEAARDTIAARKARAEARGESWHREYIAEVTISPNSPITYEQSGRNTDHYTLWGDTGTLFAQVTTIFLGSPEDEDAER